MRSHCERTLARARRLAPASAKATPADGGADCGCRCGTVPGALGQGLFQLGLHAFAALLIAIESNATDPELLRAMIASCAEAHGEGACVVAGSEQDVTATWRARVIWEDALELHARIEIRRGAAAAAPESVRSVAFSTADEPAQRHRAAGLIVASYVAERIRAEERAAQTSATAVARAPEAVPTAAKPAGSPPALAFGVDLGGLVGTALDRGPARLGATVRGFVRPRASVLGATLALRGAFVDATRGTTAQTGLLLGSGSVGALLRLGPASSALALELRVELLAELLRARAEDPVTRLPESEGRWRLGGQLGLEGHAALGGGFGLFLGADAQLLLPGVSVEVGGQDLGRARPFGASGLFGLRWSR